MKCEHKKTTCTDTRKCDGYIRRRKVCRACGEKFTTAEVIVDDVRGGRDGSALIALEQQILKKFGLTVEQVAAIEALVEAFAGGKE